MASEVTITISTSDTGAVVSGGADEPPSPRPLDEIGSSSDAPGAGGDRSSSHPPGPLPLDRLRENPEQDSSVPAPAPLTSPASSGERELPSPLPLDQLAADAPAPGGEET